MNYEEKYHKLIAKRDAECAMCGADVSTCFVSGNAENKFCRYCYYPTPKQAGLKGKPGWEPHKAGEKYDSAEHWR